ncbi:13852_t:CDS:2 [Gigaspora margarita]|uniref:13852_t:CDS:1 n=1 Tax=Gigaspora margarita TaxID=4874 RepID=A0ABN7VF28_GIGMA|nr:13852_t:CDS:2 [Gigaspora margarita]
MGLCLENQVIRHKLEDYDETDNIICQNVQELWNFGKPKNAFAEKNKENVWIKGQLALFAYSELPKQKIIISSSRLDRIKPHLKDHGMAKPIHGNTELQPDHAIINEQVKQMLNNYV